MRLLSKAILALFIKLFIVVICFNALAEDASGEIFTPKEQMAISAQEKQISRYGSKGA